MLQKDKNRKSLGGNNFIKKLWLCGNLKFSHIDYQMLLLLIYLYNNDLPVVTL